MDKTTEQKQVNTVFIFGICVAAASLLISIVNLIVTVAGTGIDAFSVIRGIFTNIIASSLVALPGIICWFTMKNYGENEAKKLDNYKLAKIIALLVIIYSGLILLTSLITLLTSFTIESLAAFILSLALNASKIIASIIVIRFEKAVKKGEAISFKWELVAEIIVAVSCVIGYLMATEVLASVIMAILFVAIFWGGIGGLKKVNWKVVKGAVIGGVIAGDVGAVVGAAAAQAKENGGSAGKVIKNAAIGTAIAGDVGAVIGAASTKTEDKK